VAKAKTPGTGGNKPGQTSTSRASSAASKPKTTTKTSTKAAPADTPSTASSIASGDKAVQSGQAVETGAGDTATGPGGTHNAVTPKPDAKAADAAKQPDTTNETSTVNAPETATSSKPVSDQSDAKPADVPKSADASKSAAVTSKAADGPKPDSDTSKTAKPETTTIKSTSDPEPSPASKASAGSSRSAAAQASAKTTPASPPQTTTSASAPRTPQKRPSVFFPMLLGGIIAGGIGFAASELDLLEEFGLRSKVVANDNATAVDNAVAKQIADQDARISALEQATPASTATDSTVVDGAAVEEVKVTLAELTGTLADLSVRVDEIANRPEAPAPAPPKVDTSAFEAELETLKSSVEAQRDEIQKLIDNATTIEEATSQAAKTASQQSAVARIVSALSTGQPFEAAIADLESVGTEDVPQALVDTAASGVVTIANLQDRFTDNARAALAAARAAAPASESGGIGGFFKQQLGARSVAPREGNDPDAVLSRAEAAIKEGRFDDALTELKSLPDAAREPLSEWLKDAQARQDAQNAVQSLTQRLTAN